MTTDDYEYRADGIFEEVILRRDQSIERAPKWCQTLITEEWKGVLTDPVSYFRKIAANSPFSAMKEYLFAITSYGRWGLSFRRFDKEKAAVGIEWHVFDSVEERFACDHATPLGLRFELPEPAPEGLPADVAALHKLVGTLSWSSYNEAGGLYAPPHVLFAPKFAPDACNFDPTQTYRWGCTLFGEILVYTLSGDAGWANYSGGFSRLGSPREAIKWLFKSLLSGKNPTAGID